MYICGSIDEDDAQEILDEILGIARDTARHEPAYAAISIAIVDGRANPLLQHRMTNATPATYSAALFKAQTAMFFGKDTIAFHHHRTNPVDAWALDGTVDLIGEGNRRACYPNRNYVSWAGGVLVVDNNWSGQGGVVGAVGVSGLAQRDDDKLASRAAKAWVAKHSQTA